MNADPSLMSLADLQRRLKGVTERQLTYWIRTHVLKPDHVTASDVFFRRNRFSEIRDTIHSFQG